MSVLVLVLHPLPLSRVSESQPLKTFTILIFWGISPFCALTACSGSIGAWIKNVEPVQEDATSENGHFLPDGMGKIRVS